jgi:two-component system response regulator ChvI
MATVLVVDDEPIVRDVVVRYLEREGHTTLEAGDGDGARALIEGGSPDLVVLDVMLPGTDGLELCRWIRSRSELPVIMLTARGEEADRIVGLELGADDYVTKPFSTRELVARIRAVERRVALASPAPGPAPAPALAGALGGEALEVGPLRLDPNRFEARWHGKPVALTRSEFQILGVLARHRGNVLAREQLLDIARGDDAVVTDRTVDTFIKRLRKKIRDVDPAFDEIETVFGVGYRYRD